MAAVRDLPKSLQIASNDAPAVLLWADRPAYVITTGSSQLMFVTLPTIGFYGGTKATTFSADNAMALDAFHKHGAAFVFFNNAGINSIYHDLSVNNFVPLKSLFDGLTVYGNYADGVIYIYYPK
jgi:hypothetical protein